LEKSVVRTVSELSDEVYRREGVMRRKILNKEKRMSD